MDLTETSPTDGPDDESDSVVQARARSLVEYLLAVRAVLERPTRTLPTSDVFWQRDLPDHPAVKIGPDGDAEPWLRVGRPSPPANPLIPPSLANVLVWDLSSDNTPHLAHERPPYEGVSGEDDAEEAVFEAWLASVWRP